MKPWIRPLTAEDARHVLENLRPGDRREVEAEVGRNYVDGLTAGCLRPGLTYAVGRERPIAIIGAQPWTSPKVWAAFMLATEEWPRVAAPVSKFVVRMLAPALDSAGIQRVECFSILGHVEAHRWLRWLGARPKGIRPTRGLNGEKFIRFVWERSNVPAVGRKTTERPKRRDRRATGEGTSGTHPHGPG